MIDPLSPECSQRVGAATALDGGEGPKVDIELTKVKSRKKVKPV